MDDLALELKATAERAEMITRGLPADVREGLAREVFRALRQPLSIQPGGGTSDPGQSFVAPRTVGMTGVETLGEYLAEFGDISHPLRLLAIAGFRFEHDATDSLTTDEFLAGYQTVRASRPQNMSVNLARCIRRGWLVQASNKDGQKSWRVTQRGLATLRDAQGRSERVS